MKSDIHRGDERVGLVSRIRDMHERLHAQFAREDMKRIFGYSVIPGRMQLHAIQSTMLLSISASDADKHDKIVVQGRARSWCLAFDLRTEVRESKAHAFRILTINPKGFKNR